MNKQTWINTKQTNMNSDSAVSAAALDAVATMCRVNVTNMLPYENIIIPLVIETLQGKTNMNELFKKYI